MTDNPDGAALLEEARRTLLEVLLPLLPPERRYDGLMVANAMAIAAREAAQGDAALREVVQQLSALFPAASAGEDPRAHLRELEARLAGEIRAGLCDAPGVRRDAVSDYLRRSVIARARVSNPKALP
jgi:AcrR family transcriptional regulator